MPKLTKRSVEAAEVRADNYLIFDDEIPGFGLRIMPSGWKSYVLQYRHRGRTKRITLGQHGRITPEEARRKARELTGDISRGADPSGEREAMHRAPTVRQVCERFLTEYVAERCKPSTEREYKRSVELFILPRLGSFKIGDVARRDVAKLHDDLRNIPYQANRTLGVLSKLFNLAEVWGLRPDGSNPCRHVKKFPEEKRERFLSLEELTRLGKVLDQVEAEDPERRSAVAAIRLLILTGCRLGEIQTLQWEHVQGDVLALPDSKTGAKRVHLGDDAREELARIERQPDNPYVIAGKVPGQYLTDMQKPWRAIRERAELPEVRIHDLRHSYASIAATNGEGLHMIGKLLGHTQVQTTARYAHFAETQAKASAERVSGTIARALYQRNEAEPEKPAADLPS